MKPPSREVLEALLTLGGSPHAWNMVMGWLRTSRDELTQRALQSADARLCGGAFELQDLISRMETARGQLDQMIKKSS